jgi:hypothetical protein
VRQVSNLPVHGMLETCPTKLIMNQLLRTRLMNQLRNSIDRDGVFIRTGRLAPLYHMGITLLLTLNLLCGCGRESTAPVPGNNVPMPKSDPTPVTLGVKSSTTPTTVAKP